MTHIAYLNNFATRTHTVILLQILSTQLAKDSHFAVGKLECRLSNSARSTLIGAVYQSSALSGVALEQTRESTLT